MKSDKEKYFETVTSLLKKGGVGVLPTDTLYGLVGSALNADVIERIYKIRKRELNKPMIILISSIGQLKDFGIKLGSAQKKYLEKIWPGKISVVLEAEGKKIDHLLRGGKTLAFRMPDDKNIRKFLEITGPLVAPSANIAGERPAETYHEAKKYFAANVDFYVDAGRLISPPSTLISLDKKGNAKVLREGAVKI